MLFFIWFQVWVTFGSEAKSRVLRALRLATREVHCGTVNGLGSTSFLASLVIRPFQGVKSPTSERFRYGTLFVLLFR